MAAHRAQRPTPPFRMFFRVAAAAALASPGAGPLAPSNLPRSPPAACLLPAVRLQPETGDTIILRAPSPVA